MSLDIAQSFGESIELAIIWPLAMPIFFIILGIILSIITWIRQKNQ